MGQNIGSYARGDAGTDSDTDFDIYPALAALIRASLKRREMRELAQDNPIHTLYKRLRPESHSSGTHADCEKREKIGE